MGEGADIPMGEGPKRFCMYVCPREEGVAEMEDTLWEAMNLEQGVSMLRYLLV